MEGFEGGLCCRWLVIILTGCSVSFADETSSWLVDSTVCSESIASALSPSAFSLFSGISSAFSSCSVITSEMMSVYYVMYTFIHIPYLQ